MAAQASLCMPGSSRRSSCNQHFNHSSHPRSSMDGFIYGGTYASKKQAIGRDASSSTLAVSPTIDPGPLTFQPSPILLSKCISSLDTPELIGMVGPANCTSAAMPPLSLPDSAAIEPSASNGSQMIDGQAPYPINLTEGFLHDADLLTPTTSDVMATSSTGASSQSMMKPSQSMLDASALLSSFCAGENSNDDPQVSEVS